MADHIEVFEEFHGVMIIFSQETFNIVHETGFNDYHHQVAAQLPNVDLSFLDEEEDDESTPSSLALVVDQVGVSSDLARVVPDPSGPSSSRGKVKKQNILHFLPLLSFF